MLIYVCLKSLNAWLKCLYQRRLEHEAVYESVCVYRPTNLVMNHMNERQSCNRNHFNVAPLMCYILRLA